MSALGRLRRNVRPAPAPAIDQNAETRELVKVVHDLFEIEAVVPPHPSKYPTHAVAEKGSVFSGVCNRTACDGAPALFYNRGTYGYYCGWCARGINGNDPKPLCIEVDHNLTHDEMNERARG